MNNRLVQEMVNGEPYEYYLLGEYIVSAPDVCSGRPTFKYTRIEVAGLLDRLAAGETVEHLVLGYQGRVPREAIEEALTLAVQAYMEGREAKEGKDVNPPLPSILPLTTERVARNTNRHCGDSLWASQSVFRYGVAHP